MQQAKTFTWSEERLTSPNEILQQQGKTDGNKIGLQTPGILLGPCFTHGGHNKSIFCYILSLVAAFSSIMPESIEWTSGQPFFGLVFLGRKSKLIGWNPEKVATTFFRVSSNTQQDAAEAIQAILEHKTDKIEGSNFLKQTTNTSTALAGTCPSCGIIRAPKPHKQRLLQCKLTRDAPPLSEAIGQGILSECYQGCASKAVMLSTRLDSTGNFLIIHYPRVEFIKGQRQRNTFKAPTQLLEQIAVTGGVDTFELRSTIVHCSVKTLYTDDTDPELARSRPLPNRGHYVCLQPEGTASIIIHNDDAQWRENGADGLAKYARQIVLAFYVKIQPNPAHLPHTQPISVAANDNETVRPPPTDESIKTSSVQTDNGAKPTVQTPGRGTTKATPPHETYQKHPRPPVTSPHPPRKKPKHWPPTYTVENRAFPKDDLSRLNRATAPFISLIEYSRVDLEQTFNPATRVIGLRPQKQERRQELGCGDHTIQIKDQDDMVYWLFGPRKEGTEYPWDRTEYDPNTKRFRNLATNKVLSFGDFSDALRAQTRVAKQTHQNKPEPTRDIPRETLKNVTTHLKDMISNTSPTGLPSNLFSEIGGHTAAEKATLTTAIRTIIATAVKQNQTAGEKTDISKWAHLLSFLTYLQSQLPTAGLLPLQGEIAALMLRLAPSHELATSSAQTCAMGFATAKQQANCLKGLCAAALIQQSLLDTFFLGLTNCTHSSKPTVLNASMSSIRKIFSTKPGFGPHHEKALSFIVETIATQRNSPDTAWTQVALNILPDIISKASTSTDLAMECLLSLITKTG
jgi:hypothetical protein